MEIVFLFLRYWGLRHHWDMHNAFVLDGRHGVEAYLRKWKGVLMCQFFYQSEWKFFPQWSILLAYCQFNMFHYPCSQWVTILHCDTHCKQCFSHTFINIIVCITKNQREREKEINIYQRPKLSCGTITHINIGEFMSSIL